MTTELEKLKAELAAKLKDRPTSYMFSFEYRMAYARLLSLGHRPVFE